MCIRIELSTCIEPSSMSIFDTRRIKLGYCHIWNKKGIRTWIYIIVVHVMDKYWYMSLIEITFKWNFFQVDEGGLDLEVTNLPSGVYEKKIQSRLKKLSENCGGRVVSVCKDVAVLRFKCHNDAAKYVTSYWNIETSYWNIKTSHWNIKTSYWNMLFCGDCFGLLVKWGGDLGVKILLNDR